MCEMDVRKQRWSLSWNPDWPVPRDGHVTPCMFINMQDMGKPTARCCVHGLQEQLCVFFRPGRLVLHSGVDELVLEEHMSEILKVSLIAVCGFFAQCIR